MTVYIALLQGVNVGKHKRIAMADFKQIVAELGGDTPVTVANSGNVVFRDDDSRSVEELRLAIEQAVSEHVGMPIPTFIRTGDELRSIVASNPYPEVDDPKCLHVDFLLEAVDGALDDLDLGDDHLTLTGRDLYMHLPNKMSGVTHDSNALAKRLGTHHTSRNWNTVTKLADLATSLE